MSSFGPTVSFIVLILAMIGVSTVATFVFCAFFRSHGWINQSFDVEASENLET